jgi:hypothetical protein
VTSRISPDLVDRLTAAVTARDGRVEGAEVRFRCPAGAEHANGDAHPSARWNGSTLVWCCDVCGAGGGAYDLADRLGIQRPRRGRGGRVVRTTTYAIRDAAGVLVAEHVRIERAAGAKRFAWRREGKPGLSGLAARDLPLYRGETLASDPTSTVALVEGEKATDALLARGIVAVGTVTGAGGTPSDDVLRVLVGRDVVCWPDADAPGRRHMQRIASRLAALGIAARWYDPAPAATDGRDAADDDRDGDTLRAALAGAPRWMPSMAKTDSVPDELPVIPTSGRALRDVTTDALRALVAANDPPVLFARFGGLARVRPDERGRPLVERVTDSLLRHRLERVAQFTRSTPRGDAPAPPPLDVVQDLIALGSWPLPALEAVVEVPVLRPDGTVFRTRGYDPATRLVYLPASEIAVPAISDAPTSAERDAARDLLLDLIAEFPFADCASRSNMLALLLTPVLRPAIAGQVPLALVDKPKRGTGATLLAQLVTVLAVGSATDLTTAPRDDEEWRKKITAALMAGATILFFDNVEHVLSSPSLAAALTTPRWNDRILGRSEIARDLPQRATWMATGNNMKVGGDLARRCYWIRLDAGLARPWTRDGFRHADLLGYVLRNRGSLLAAALTLARAWFAAGSPPAEVPALGGFESWARTVGGVLGHVGIGGFLENLSALYDVVDEEEVAWESFIAAWFARHGEAPVTVAELTAEIRAESSRLRDVLPPELVEALSGRGSFERRLGRALGRRADAVFGTYRLRRVGKDAVANALRWRVVAAPGRVSGFPGSVSPVAGSDADVDDGGGMTSGNRAQTNPGNPETRTERVRI